MIMKENKIEKPFVMITSVVISIYYHIFNFFFFFFFFFCLCPSVCFTLLVTYRQSVHVIITILGQKGDQGTKGDRGLDGQRGKFVLFKRNQSNVQLNPYYSL